MDRLWKKGRCIGGCKSRRTVRQAEQGSTTSAHWQAGAKRNGKTISKKSLQEMVASPFQACIGALRSQTQLLWRIRSFRTILVVYCYSEGRGERRGKWSESSVRKGLLGHSHLARLIVHVIQTERPPTPLVVEHRLVGRKFGNRASWDCLSPQERWFWPLPCSFCCPTLTGVPITEAS